MKAVILAPEGLADVIKGWPISIRQLGQDEKPKETEQAFTDEELAKHIQSLQAEQDAFRTAIVEPYLITDLFDRLAMDEWATIKTLAKSNPQIEYLWDKLLSLHEGIECPPDGATPGRVLSAQAKGLCAQIFGQERADQLFAK